MIMEALQHNIPSSCDQCRGQSWQSGKGQGRALNLMAIRGLILYIYIYFFNCTITIFSQKLLYFYYFIPHSGQLQSTKKRNTYKHRHLGMDVLNPLHLRSSGVHDFFIEFPKICHSQTALFTYKKWDNWLTKAQNGRVEWAHNAKIYILQ